MPSTEFHILETPSAMPAWRYACQLVDQAYQEKHAAIYLHMDTRDEAERMDTLLWTFQDDSFLPHQLYNPTETNRAPIEIGYSHCHPVYTEPTGTLINLSRDIPPNHLGFSRLIEIIFSDPSVQQFGRERFKHYRTLGYPLHTHKLKTL